MRMLRELSHEYVDGTLRGISHSRSASSKTFRHVSLEKGRPRETAIIISTLNKNL